MGLPSKKVEHDEGVEPRGDAGVVLNLFAVREADAWRLHVAPQWLPRYLVSYFDDNGEAFPVELDLEDLDRHMTQHEAEYERRDSKLGGVELTARGEAANALALWLSNVFGSMVRPRQR